MKYRSAALSSCIIAAALSSLFVFLASVPAVADASTSFNQEINYQGRLTTAAGVAVANGSYDMRFNLYTVSSNGTAVWQETDCDTADGTTTNCVGTGTDNRVTVSNGLFSILLGSTTPFAGVNFNQTLYLSVEIGGTSTSSPSWDGQMSPRKLLGTVPAAMTAASLNGVSDTQLFRNDTANSTSSSNAFLNITQTGTGAVAMFTGATTSDIFSILSNGNVGIGTSSPGWSLAVVGNAFFTGNATATNITATGTLTVTGTATSTFSGGIVATCFATSTAGGCITGGSTGGGVSLSAANTWSGQQTFGTIAPIFGTITQGSILFAGASGLLSQNNSQFFWDNTNNALDIGTTSANINSNVNVAQFNVIATTTNEINLALFRANVNSTGQVEVVNANAGTTSGAELVVGNNLNDTNAAGYFGDFGINSSANVNPVATGFLANDTYLYSSDSNLDLAAASTTASVSSIRFFTDGRLTANQRMVITGAGLVGIGSSTPGSLLSLFTNSGSAGTTTLFTIASSTSGNAATTTIFTVLGNGNVGIGSTSPASMLGIAGTTTTNGLSIGSLTGFLQATAGVVSATSTISLTANVSGILPAANGGTGVNSFGGTNTLLYTTAANTLSSITTANSSFLLTNSSGVPSWGTTLPAFTLGGTVTGTGQIDVGLKQLAIGTTTPYGAVLIQQGNGSTSPLFTVASTTSATYATSSLFTVLASGNVGVGSSTPGSLFSIFTNSGAVNTTPLFTIASSTATNTATTTILTVLGNGKVGIGTSSPSNATFTVSGSVCISQGQGVATTTCGSAAGNIYSKASNLGNYDVAEDYPTSDVSLGAGDIVAVDPTSPGGVVKASHGARILGVISTAPGLLLGGAAAMAAGENVVPVALSGRVPIYVSTEGGPISIGDPIALSSMPGVGKKAGANSGDEVGIALEPYFSAGIGTIEVFVNLRQSVDFSRFDQASSSAVFAGAASSPADSIADQLMEGQISSLGSEVGSLVSFSAEFASGTAMLASASFASATIAATASATASTLASSTPFIEAVANAVENLISGMGTWVVGKLSGTVAIFDRVQTQTVAVTAGIEMTDEATGQIWCMRIRNGDWDKTLGQCQTSSTSSSSSSSAQGSTTVTGTSLTNPVVSMPVLSNDPASAFDATDAGAATEATATTTEAATSTVPTTSDAVATSTTITGTLTGGDVIAPASVDDASTTSATEPMPANANSNTDANIGTSMIVNTAVNTTDSTEDNSVAPAAAQATTSEQ